MSVEDILLEDMDRLQIARPQRDSINRYLDLLKMKHYPSYEHSIRVGDLAGRMAKCLGEGERQAWYVGTLHDVGKSLIRKSLLDKRERFNDSDMDEMKSHPLYSHELLRDVFNFSAEGAVRHHRYQSNSYPVDLPETCQSFSAETLKAIDNCAQIVAIADFYDALKTRNNEKYKEEKEKFSAREILIRAFPAQKDKIEILFDRGILL
jgi:HD-GYP domain-containing protein (c-di-GMP phosphodiesterase class II)